MSAYALLCRDMNWLPQDWNERMTVLFLIFLAALLLAMKVVAFLIRNFSFGDTAAFWFTPLPAPNSLLRCAPNSELTNRLVQALLCGGALGVFYWAYWHLIDPTRLPTIILSYLAAPVLLGFSSVLLTLCSLLWRPNGKLFPALHNSPWLMRSVSDFWGRRWNLWFSDWFHYAIFTPLRRRPVLAVVLVFFVSGVMHEWVVNLPLYLVTGKKLFGTMVLYFLLQAGGLLLERHYFAEKRNAKILLAWLTVFLPAPLVLNEGLLRALRLFPH